MADNKSQHYVPRQYLKRFSKNGVEICVYNKKTGKIITDKGVIKKQCQKDYFYSTNLDFEKTLGKIESDVDIILSRIIKNENIDKNLIDDYILLVNYLIIQNARTLNAADDLNKSTSDFLKILMKEKNKYENNDEITEEDIETAIIKYPEPALFNIQNSVLNTPLLYDLNCKVLVNRSGREFITSDNPVVLYNYYFIDNIFSYMGLASKGLIIFFPISVNICLVFYDKILYRMGGKKMSSNIILYDQNDIIELNRLQIINSHKCFYSMTEKSVERNDEYIEIVGNINDKNGTVDKTAVKLKDGTVADNVIWSTKGKIRYKTKLSFLKINKKVSPEYLTKGRNRDEILCKIHKEYSEKVVMNELKPEDWSDFLDTKLRNGL